MRPRPSRMAAAARKAALFLIGGAVAMAVAAGCSLLVDGVAAKRWTWLAAGLTVSVAGGVWHGTQYGRPRTGASTTIRAFAHRRGWSASMAEALDGAPFGPGQRDLAGEVFTGVIGEATHPGPTWAQVSSILTAHADSQRVLLVPPEQEAYYRAAVDERGWTGVVTVKASPHCPPGRVLLLGTGAINKAVRAAAERPLRDRPPR